MITKEDENDNEVRREDQDRINQFARLNARLQDNKSEREQIKVGDQDCIQCIDARFSGVIHITFLFNSFHYLILERVRRFG
jgi:hypothetical protein